MKKNEFLALVNLEDGSLQFLNQTLHDAEMIISVNGDEDTREFLLVFQKLGIYVDSQGLHYLKWNINCIFN